MSKMYGWGFHLRRLRKDYNKLEDENEALKEDLGQINMRLANYQGNLADMVISLEDEKKP